MLNTPVKKQMKIFTLGISFRRRCKNIAPYKKRASDILNYGAAGYSCF